MKKPGVVRSLGRIGNVLASREAKHHATANEQNGERCDEGRHPQDCDQHAIDQADHGAKENTEQKCGGEAVIIMARREDNREGNTDEAKGRADRKIDILVDDDKCHAHRHDAVAGGIAQQRMKRVGGAKECGIDEGASDVEQRHEAKQTRFPSANKLRRGAAFQNCSALNHENPMRPIPRPDTLREGSHPPAVFQLISPGDG